MHKLNLKPNIRFMAFFDGIYDIYFDITGTELVMLAKGSVMTAIRNFLTAPANL